MPSFSPILAMSPTTGALLWAGVLIVLAMVGGVVITIVRRRTLSRDAGMGDAGLMEQLRAMVDSGRMTPEEFDMARRKIVERAAAERAPKAPTSEDD